MIKLEKVGKPQVLVDNDVNWTKDVLDKVGRGLKISDAVGRRYSHPDIKTTLLAETNEKCAYCESKVTHIAFGDVEHIIAKAIEPERALEWENLTIACDKCNQNKSDIAGVLDPYTIEPNDHLVVLGPLVKGRPDSDLGIFTERTLKLNRMQLVERRLEKIDYISNMQALAHRVDDVHLRETIVRDIKACSNSDKEYSATAAAYIHALNL